ncbi:MAG TPA: rhomboid family intramembrane serine protease [Solirubrobacteraceae bacterium]|jgi:membrane associated rhomboid family serine protease|nr:rhomboid family intramembrane serine protease [Solirubrobacteraceae bacterium]
MAPGADLFVVCKHCGSEVSPYITECPYCGQRLRRRAPKLPREDAPSRARHGLLRGLGSRAAGRAPAPQRASRRSAAPSALAATIAARPYATVVLVAASAVMWVLLRAGFITSDKLLLIGPLHGDWWKLFSSQFAYLDGWYAFFTLLVIAIFGWLLERRYGAIVVVALFLGAGVAGALVALAVYPFPIVLGGNAAALALLAAWAAPDLRAAREHSYYEGDLLGAGACAALILAIPFAQPEASWLAGVVGGLLGLLVGLGLAQVGPADA